MARPLDGRCYQPLELGGRTGHTTRQNLAAVGNEAAKGINVLVINKLCFDEGEVANLAALKATARAATISTHATTVTTIATVSTAVAAITTAITAAGAGCAGGAATFCCWSFGRYGVRTLGCFICHVGSLLNAESLGRLFWMKFCIEIRMEGRLWSPGERTRGAMRRNHLRERSGLPTSLHRFHQRNLHHHHGNASSCSCSRSSDR